MKLMTILLSVLIAVAFIVGSAMAVLPGKTVVFPDGPMGKVTFNGDTHGMKQGLKCSDCHPDPFGPPMKKEKLMKFTKADHVAGKFCGKCHDGEEHNGKVVFAWSNPENCTKCHKKSEEAPAEMAPAATHQEEMPAATPQEMPKETPY